MEENSTTATIAVANPSHLFGHPLEIKGDGVDSISSLPDEILQHILSFFPLTDDAITTSVLSKRWRHVWCKTPCLSFSSCNSQNKWIRETLDSYSATKIMSFHLFTQLDSRSDPHVNSLIKFAMSHNVEKLTLGLWDSYCGIPDCLFSNFSAKQLRSLCLRTCALSTESLSRMLAGCPMLESLTLKSIPKLESLDLTKSLWLKRLDLHFSPYNIEPMQIVAPHISSLTFRNLRLIRYQAQDNGTLVDVSSLTVATINFNFDDLRYINDPLVALQAMMQTLVEKLHKVENLNLGSGFLQILSLAELRGVPFPTLKVKTLTLETRILRSVVPGISRLLQTSPGLKKITLYAFTCNTALDKSYLDSESSNWDQCWRLEDVAFPFAWESKVAEPKLVASFVELLLANTKTLETLVLRLGSYFDRSRLGELSQIIRTLSHNSKVSIVIK